MTIKFNDDFKFDYAPVAIVLFGLIWLLILLIIQIWLKHFTEFNNPIN